MWSGAVDRAPTLKPSIGQVSDTTPTESILGFLHGGSLVIRAAGLSEDWLAPSHPECVPLAFRTDGAWIWPAEIAYYLAHHGLLPEPDFLAHMAANGYVARTVADETIDEAERLLRKGN